MSYRIAIGTLDGKEVTEHFGRAKGFRIIEINQESGDERLIADISVVGSEDCSHGHDEQMLQTKIQALLDHKVNSVLVRQIGPKSERLLNKNNIEVLVAEGDVNKALTRIKIFYKRHVFQQHV